MRRWILVLASAAAIAVSCDEAGPTGPTVPLDREFVLGPGELAAIRDTSLVVRFDHVTGDSRCPADALCVLGGDATVWITVIDGGNARQYDLHTGSMAPARHDRVTIALVSLAPYPFSARPIDPADYRATLRATR
jgi:hypothetical protein